MSILGTGNQAAEIYGLLYSHYGDLNWWPARTPYEVIVGAVLTQNTAWSNVEKVFENFSPTPEAVAQMDIAELADIIRPSGFFNQKSVYLKAVTEWFSKYGYSVEAVQRGDFAQIRAELLATKGIGKETADSILLYAFGFPTFVVDAYTVRLCERYPLCAGKGYDAVKAYFEANLERDAGIFNNYHAMIVINAKEHCRKKPQCGNCPLRFTCKTI